MSISAKVAGAWQTISSLYVKVSGTWKQCIDVYVNVSGTWKSVMYAAGSTEYTDAGTYSFTVPAGVYSLTIPQLVGAGGGSGATNSSGNIIGSGCGGSGGYLTGLTISVTPLETLTITIGAGGFGGNYRFNSNYQYFNSIYPTWPSQNTGTYNGGAGGDTSISRGSTVLYSATGGGGGLSMSSGGAAGYPNGVAGGAWNGNTGQCNTLMYGGVNALGKGSGGNNPQCTVGEHGQNGYMNITW